jgi:alpha- and gamma-adaptin-binding protein p34
METTKSKKKVLILGRPKSGKLSLVKALTSSFPPELADESASHAGLTHSITLTNRYFSTEAGIWIDEIPENSGSWLEEYLSEEATPVLQSLAAIILTVSAGSPNPELDVAILKKLNERGVEVGWDATSLVVGKHYLGNDVFSAVSSFCNENTLEFINLNESGENEFGGPAQSLQKAERAEKQGLPRVLEVLHTCDWTAFPDEDEESVGSLHDGELDFELNAFEDDQQEDKQDGSEQEVEYMERMMAMLLNARGILAN